MLKTNFIMPLTITSVKKVNIACDHAGNMAFLKIIQRWNRHYQNGSVISCFRLVQVSSLYWKTLKCGIIIKLINSFVMSCFGLAQSHFGLKLEEHQTMYDIFIKIINVCDVMFWTGSCHLVLLWMKTKITYDNQS